VLGYRWCGWPTLLVTNANRPTQVLVFFTWVVRGVADTVSMWDAVERVASFATQVPSELSAAEEVRGGGAVCCVRICSKVAGGKGWRRIAGRFQLVNSTPNHVTQQDSEDATAAGAAPGGGAPGALGVTARAVSDLHRCGASAARRLHSAQRAALAAARTRSTSMLGAARAAGGGLLGIASGGGGAGAQQRASLEAGAGPRRKSSAELIAATPWHRKSGAGDGFGAGEGGKISISADGTAAGKHGRSLEGWPATGAWEL
jgi:hypothetical protein